VLRAGLRSSPAGQTKLRLQHRCGRVDLDLPGLRAAIAEHEREAIPERTKVVPDGRQSAEEATRDTGPVGAVRRMRVARRRERRKRRNLPFYGPQRHRRARGARRSKDPYC
jgi:hypothetical protein